MPSVEITTPFPSIEETAERAGVSPKRAREIVDLAEGISGQVGARGQRAIGHRAAKKSRGIRKRAPKRAPSKS
jgi:hypothetical protein